MSTSAYREFTGKSVEEALRLAREDFGVGCGFEIMACFDEALFDAIVVFDHAIVDHGWRRPRRSAVGCRPSAAAWRRTVHEDRR